jgi:N-acetyl sugar amidotransferase
MGALRYCDQCILPASRPGLVIGDDGVCSACRAHSTTSAPVDWAARRARFEALVAEVRELGRDWDCVIPVSGGKDSTWQVVLCLEHGLKPLAVTWRPWARTEIGRRNLDNLISLGVDHVDFTVNPRVDSAFMLRTLERVGSPAVPMHLAIFNIPTTIAVRHGIPLVVWGENSALEYVGDDDAAFELTPDWVRRYGAVHGTTAEDWVCDGLGARDLAPYRGPSEEELRAAGVRAVFLGMFVEWDPEETYRVAAAHGFEPGERPRTGTWAHADIDDDFISIHHWLKWPKFGFTRAWDNLSLDIRRGRLSRDEAIDVIAELGDQTPHDDIRAFCAYAGITEDRFFAIAESFRDRSIWTRGEDGVWRIDGFLIPDFEWR